MNEYLNYICAIIGALIGYFFGEIDGFIHALLTFVILDYITGILAAYRTKTLSSSVGFTGISRKITIFVLVGIAHIIGNLLGQAALVRDAVIFFYLANEGLSILENAIILGLPVPEILKKRLLQLNHDSDLSH